MKKIKLLTTTVLAGIVLAACSSNNTETPKSTTSSPSSSQASSSKQAEVSNTAEQGTTPYPQSSYKTPPIDLPIPNGNSYKITAITKSTSSLDNSPILLLEMDFTNNGKNPTSPYMAFVIDWDVQQTDGITTQNLNGANGQMANVENQEAVLMGDTKVNPGATVHAIIGYKLADEKADVGFIVRASQIANNPQGFAWANK